MFHRQGATEESGACRFGLLRSHAKCLVLSILCSETLARVSLVDWLALLGKGTEGLKTPGY